MPQTLNSLPGWERKCQGCLGALLGSQVGRRCLHVVLVDLACGYKPVPSPTQWRNVKNQNVSQRDLQSITAHILG